jgi:hypothetical protein
MIPLENDQIHTPAFQRLCDFMWADDFSRKEKSGIWGYSVQCEKDYGLKLVDETTIPQAGILFIGLCHLIESVFDRLPRNGSYIIVHRTNDRPFTNEMYARKPQSVKHIYSVDCRVNRPDVTAIPFGLASINGEDNSVKQIKMETVSPAETKLFVRYNVNRDTPHRNESLLYLRDKSFAKVIEYQIPVDEFLRNVKAHKFTMALAGCGADAGRQYQAIILGSIPIVTDCIEMRHFEDLPLVYCPTNINDLTEEWLDRQTIEGKSTDRMRMSYWTEHLNKMKEIL